MLGIINKGNNFTNLLTYHFAKISEGTAELIDNRVSLEDNLKDMASAFETVSANRVSSKLQYEAASVMISFENNEQVNNDTLCLIAEHTLDHLGYDNNPYAVFRHNDTDNLHIHITVSRVNYDGYSTSDFLDFEKIQEAMRHLEKQYDLKPTLKQTLSRHKSFGEHYTAANKAEEFLKGQVLESIREALIENNNIDDYMASLQHKGIYCRILHNKQGHRYIKYGINRNGETYYFSESNIDYAELDHVNYALKNDKPLVKKAAHEQLTYMRRIIKRAYVSSSSWTQYREFLNNYGIVIKANGGELYYGNHGVENPIFYLDNKIDGRYTLNNLSNKFELASDGPTLTSSFDNVPRQSKPKLSSPGMSSSGDDEEKEEKRRKRRR